MRKWKRKCISIPYKVGKNTWTMMQIYSDICFRTVRQNSSLLKHYQQVPKRNTQTWKLQSPNVPPSINNVRIGYQKLELQYSQLDRKYKAQKTDAQYVIKNLFCQKGFSSYHTVFSNRKKWLVIYINYWIGWSSSHSFNRYILLKLYIGLLYIYGCHLSFKRTKSATITDTFCYRM